jgi:hypothetical protein
VSVHPEVQHTSPPLQHWSPTHSDPPSAQICVEKMHCPSTQPALPPSASASQSVPQEPQLFTSVWTSVQPSSQHCCTPLHAGPPLHESALSHNPPTQLCPGAHWLVQSPQWIGETSMFTHVVPQHASSTSRHPTSWQLWAGWHAAARHGSPSGQASPHPPQFCGSVPSSTQAGLQHESPWPHAAPSPQKPTHSLPTQMSPGGHCDELTQPTHVPVGTSQIGFVAGHCEFIVQPPGGRA